MHEKTFTINIKVWAAKVICQVLMYMNSLGDAFQFSIICSWDSFFSFLGLLSFCKSFSRPRWRLGNKELSQLWKWADQNPVRFTVSAFVIPSKFWLVSEFSSNKLKIEGVNGGLIFSVIVQLAWNKYIRFCCCLSFDVPNCSCLIFKLFQHFYVFPCTNQMIHP